MMYADYRQVYAILKYIDLLNIVKISRYTRM